MAFCGSERGDNAGGGRPGSCCVSHAAAEEEEERPPAPACSMPLRSVEEAGVRGREGCGMFLSFFFSLLGLKLEVIDAVLGW